MTDDRRKQFAQEQHDRQREKQAEQQATSAATRMAAENVSRRMQNPQFFAQLRDPDIDTDLHDWLDNEVTDLAGGHIVGQRSGDYEREVKWLTRNEAERHLAEGSAGRLCKGHTREVAHGTHRRNNADAPTQYTPDERRGVRDAYEVSANMKALAIHSQGLRSVTEATAVARTEKLDENDDDGWREKAGRFMS